MKKLIFLLMVTLLLMAQENSETRTIHLKSGDVLTGTIVKQDSVTDYIQLKTNFGVIKINSDDILPEVVMITMKNGDHLKGILISETNRQITIKANFGVITLDKNNIERIDFGLQKEASVTVENQEKYTYGLERQIDVFYDPTGYCLKKGVLYISGLSWGFGLTDKIQLTSKYYDYFFGNFNIRPKFQVFRKGNMEKETALSVGFHFHNRHLPDKFEWREGKFDASVFDEGVNAYTGETKPYYYGGYYRIGTEIELEGSSNIVYHDYGEYGWLDNDYIDVMSERKMYSEVFGAYTISKARAGNRGRIYHTFGGYVGKFQDSETILYKLYYAGAVDVRKKVIFNYEIFYDPYYVELWYRDSFFEDGWVNLVEEEVDKPYVSPVHFDIGFIYSINDWLHFGLHFQPYILGVYLKF